MLQEKVTGQPVSQVIRGLYPPLSYTVQCMLMPFFCKDIRKLITRALKELPANDRYAMAVKEMLALYDKYPKDWVKARQIMAKNTI